MQPVNALKSYMNPRLYIHGHSCCEIRYQNSALLCDPWLVGSAYWRSWWNFPPQSDLEELLHEWQSLDTLFIYITHLHWDHFHGPTLRRIVQKCKNVHFLLPLTPEKRLSNDLRLFTKGRPLTELVHCKKYNLTSWLRVLSYQSGPFFADSALFIDAAGHTVLNANDSKFGIFSMRAMRAKISSPKFILRSHSSANYRVCKRELDGSEYFVSPDKDGHKYSAEFYSFCCHLRSDYAIPFASNMAYLHKDTFDYNSSLNSSDYVVDACASLSASSSPRPILLLPGESLDLASCLIRESQRSREMLHGNRLAAIASYAQNKSTVLEKHYRREDVEAPNVDAMLTYFTAVARACPFPFKHYLGKHIYIHSFSNQFSVFLNIDFIGARAQVISTPPELSGNDVCFVVHPYVLNDVCKQRHFNSLGVSKRLRILADSRNPRDVVFNYLCNTFEANGILNPETVFTWRFWLAWLRRWPEIIDLSVMACKAIYLSIIVR